MPEFIDIVTPEQVYIDVITATAARKWGFITGDINLQTDLINKLLAKADRKSEILTGGIITVGTFGGSGVNNDIRVSAASYYILNQGAYNSLQTDFNDIALSSAGNQRYIGLYGTTLGTITKVEGVEAPLASFPAQPADTCLMGYVLVTDSASSSTPDLSGYLLKSDKATAANVSSGSSDSVYMTPSSFANSVTTTTVVSSSTPTPVVSANKLIIDELIITALATNATIAVPSGAPANGKRLLMRIKDNGTARTLTFNAIYRASSSPSLPTTTTVNKTMYLLFVYNSTDSKWDLLAFLNNI